jgi:hypothetical protein
VHDFLSWYNPIAGRLRRYTGVLRFPPVFTFWAWILGLAALTIVVLALTPWAFDRRAIMRPLAVIFAVINTLNGLQHIVTSLVQRRRLPGVLSAPLLLGTALWLLYAAMFMSEGGAIRNSTT